MTKILIVSATLVLTFLIEMAYAAELPKVTYIDAPVFPDQIYLYGEPNKADVDAEQWYEIEGRGQFVRNVKVPTLIPYLPDAGKSNGAAIIIAPGGAFLYHTFGSGGYEAAEWFKNHGFATFILKYRVEETPRSEEDYQVYVAEKMAGYRAGGRSGNYAPATPDYAFEDVNAAVRLIRGRADEFHIKPDRIGIVGFSAGALMAVYNAERAEPESKADFIGSIYGQLVLRDMPDKVPPMFAAMSSDDELSGQSGFEVIQAWQKHGIVELHLYGQGGHNFGMGHEPFTNALWPTEFMAWLRMLKIIDEPSSEAKILLNKGPDTPPVGIGTFRSSVEQAHDAGLAALKAGHRHIDTAHAAERSKTLVAVFSRAGENYSVGEIEKGNTQIIAEMIAERTGAELFEIRTARPYPKEYKATTDLAKKEQREKARPALAEDKDLSGYDTIFLGYPNWWGDMPMAVYTFIEAHDWSEKTVIPFCTHEGSGLSGTENTLKRKLTGAKVLKGLAVHGSTAQNSRDTAQKSVMSWLENLKHAVQ